MEILEITLNGNPSFLPDGEYLGTWRSNYVFLFHNSCEYVCKAACGTMNERGVKVTINELQTFTTI